MPEQIENQIDADLFWEQSGDLEYSLPDRRRVRRNRAAYNVAEYGGEEYETV